MVLLVCDSQVTAHSCLVLGRLVGLGASFICVAVVSVQAREMGLLGYWYCSNGTIGVLVLFYFQTLVISYKTNFVISFVITKLIITQQASLGLCTWWEKDFQHHDMPCPNDKTTQASLCMFANSPSAKASHIPRFKPLTEV